MPGADPRSEDDTDEIPPAVEAFTIEPRPRGSTNYIVGRAVAVMGLLRRDAWAGEEQPNVGAIGPFEPPIWTEDALADVLTDMTFRGSPRALRAWAAELPDGALPETRPRVRPEAEIQRAASLELAENAIAPERPALLLVASSLMDEHPLVRVAAAATIAHHGYLAGAARIRPNPWAQAILDDAVGSRSDEVGAVAAAVQGGIAPPEPSFATESGTLSERSLRPDAALVHGTWAPAEAVVAKSEAVVAPDGGVSRLLAERGDLS